jgi:hypothetical protein
MQTFRTEAYLTDPVSRHLRRRRFRAQFMEAPFYDYRIDIFGFSQSEDLCIAVELKLARWQRALEQALIYQLCADYAYVAMPKHALVRVPLDGFQEHGVGLIAVSGAGCNTIIPAQRSSVVRNFYRTNLIHLLQEQACPTLVHS